MYQNDPMKVLTGEVRLSYAHLSEPYANPQTQGAKPKYSVTLLIPKTDTTTYNDIMNAIAAATNEAVNKVWNGVKPPVPKIPLWDGDGVRQSGLPFGDECKGHWVMTASSTQRPQVVDQSNINVELDPRDAYSGMYARVTIRFFGYSNSGNKGIGCGLGNIMKTRDGEPLAGGASAATDFAGIGQSVDPAQAAYQNVAYQTTPGAAGGHSAAGLYSAAVRTACSRACCTERVHSCTDTVRGCSCGWYQPYNGYAAVIRNKK